MNTIVLIDDHVMLRRGLAQYLAATGKWQIAGETGSLEEAKALLDSLRDAPDLIILDIDMKNAEGEEENGLDLLPWLDTRYAASRRAPKTVVYTVYSDYGHVHAAIKAGAMSFVAKNASEDTLEQTLETVLQGKRCLDPSLNPRLYDAADMLSRLTRREKDIFLRVQQGQDNRRIAQDLAVSKRTVENHLSVIYDKLGVNSREDIQRL
jgi:DNA-binding NarL/FixJ family response regulator